MTHNPKDLGSLEKAHIQPDALMADSSFPIMPLEEDSDSLRDLLKAKIKLISCEALSEMIASKTNIPVILDCRPFIAHNINHIQGAVNINCSSRVNRKRLQQGKAFLADLATTIDGKEKLKDKTWKEAVVYDESTDNTDDIHLNLSLYITLRALIHDQREPFILKGGHKQFNLLFTSLCENHLVDESEIHREDVDSNDLQSSDEALGQRIETHPVINFAHSTN